jgi:hypothetical protein
VGRTDAHTRQHWKKSAQGDQSSDNRLQPLFGSAESSDLRLAPSSSKRDAGQSATGVATGSSVVECKGVAFEDVSWLVLVDEDGELESVQDIL